MHSEMSFRRLRTPDDGSPKHLPMAMFPGLTSSAELYAPAHQGHDMPMSKFQFHSEKAIRRTLPVDESHLKDVPADYLPFERPAETGKYRFLANRSIEESPHFYPAK